MKPMLVYQNLEKILKLGEKWDAITPTQQEAVAYAVKYLNKEPSKYIGNTTQFSREYLLACSAETINERMRNGTAEKIDLQIAEQVSNYAIRKDIVLYRGVDETTFEKMKVNAKGKKGIDLLEKGFLSTSLVKGHEIERPVKLRIYLQRGAAAVFMGNVKSCEEYYYEVTTQCGTMLKVLTADKEYINCKCIGFENHWEE